MGSPENSTSEAGSRSSTTKVCFGAIYFVYYSGFLDRSYGPEVGALSAVAGAVAGAPPEGEVSDVWPFSTGVDSIVIICAPV